MEIIHGLLFAALGLMASSVFTSMAIPIIKSKQFGQFIREDGPQSHLSKAGTPTMGGIAIIAAIIMVTIVGKIYTKDTFVILAVLILFGLIGFLDDYIKIAKKHNLGLRAWQKLVLQILLGIGLGVYMATFNEHGTAVWIPFYGQYVDFGMFFIPFIAFVVVAMANAVNLTDGLDGLSSGVSAIVTLFFGYAAVLLGSASAGVISFAIMGACLGFLAFNKFPAQIFMGDTGSMAIGGGLAAAAIIMKAELLLPIAGIIYVAEAVSVIIQVVSFKTRGKRVFRMAPIHHHFEEGGMKETAVVKMFWGITVIACIAATIILNF